MEELFIWYYSTHKLPKGVPVSLDTSIVEIFNPKKPMQNFDFTWVKYNAHFMDYPPENAALRLPKELFLVIKKCKQPEFDFISKKIAYKIFSEKLYKLLVENGLNKSYESANITLLDTKGKNIESQTYYLLRFGDFDDGLFDFNEETKLESSIECIKKPI